MKRTKIVLKILACIPIVFILFSCNPLENISKSNSILIVIQITGTDIEGNEANFLQSDVVKVVEGQSSITADTASAALKAELLDPTCGVESSIYNDIMVTRYVVSYSRSDGKNTPGVDVPYSFEGALSTLIPIGSSSTISFIIVREVAKLEPPLINLVQGGGEVVLEVTAKIDFYGHDLANNKVKATGYLTIFFANYIDQ